MEIPARPGKLTRRTLLTGAAGYGAGQVLPLHHTQAKESVVAKNLPASIIPDALLGSFTTNVEKVNKESFSVQQLSPIEANDGKSNGLSALVQGRDGSVLMT